MNVRSRAPATALSAAALFGMSTPAAKALLGEMDPWMLGALLYLGSGGALGAYLVLRRLRGAGSGHPSLAARDLPWLAAAIVAGGVAAPVLLMFGLARTSAAAVALLLNLEAVFTALLAWLVVREHFVPRIAWGLACIVAGAVALSGPGSGTAALDLPALLVTAAALAWAIDNNVTRKISGGDPVTLATTKGLAAGTVNLGIAVMSGSPWPSPPAVAGALVVGALGYGVSLVLFIVALRELGTARTAAYFSTAPFIGALGAIAGLREPLTATLGVAGALMAAGVWLHLTERHEHEHVHDPIAHEHRHVHDAHHTHAHAPQITVTEPHSHWHEHEALRHRHPHYPDLHHRHPH
ncbi:MAG: DMT family transporter [Candidatus Rokuibacteriota bacterium]